MWEVDSWQRLWTRPRADLAFGMFSPDGAYVLQQDRKFFLELLAANSGRLLGQIEAPRMAHLDSAGATFSPHATYLAVHSRGTRELYVWHLSKMREQLARLGLDWDLPPLREEAPTNPPPLAVRFVGEVQ